MTREAGSEKCCAAGSEDGGRVPGAKEFRQSLETARFPNSFKDPETRSGTFVKV